MRSKSFAPQQIIGLILALGPFMPPALAQDGRAIYKKTIRGTALVRVRVSDTATSQGTCWVVDRPRKLLVTNYHVVGSAELVNVVFPVYADDKAFQNGRPLSNREDYQSKLGLTGRVLDTDTERDLAIIQLELLPEGVEELKLAGESAGPGDRVHSVGNPGASDAMWVHADGGVRAVYHKRWAYLVGKQTVRCNAWVLETQTPTNPGDSGGPMVNAEGEVVAVVSGGRAMYQGKPVQAMNWGVELREVRSFVEQTTRLLTPKTVADYLLRGERYLKRQRYSQATSDFNAALQLDTANARAYRLRGSLLRQKGDLETALADLNRAIDLDGKDAEAYFERGQAYWRQGKNSWDKAVADYTRAIQLNPGHALASNNRGVIHEFRGEFELAFVDYNQAIEKHSSFAQAYVNRADIYRKRGDFKQALADYDRAFQIAPSPYGVQQAALTYLDSNEPRVAVNLSLLLVKEFQVSDALTYRIQGLGYKGLGDATAAINSLSEAIKRDQTHAFTYFWRGQLYEEAGDSRALADYEKAVQLNAKLAVNLKTHQRRYLKVVNNIMETLQFHLHYETLTEQDEWYWYPETPPKGKALTVTVESGKTLLVEHGGYRVQGRRLRIWADAPQSGRQITTHKDKDVALCAKEYQSMKQMTFTYTFGTTANK